ncbi:MAG: transporter substrate-binding domain-containing protein [Deltaproteobacteria bacterium]|jgi:polar amino acid transport system substrate-binding protein|nr:transporter substrate-binding domain-containing protein [Deltaproteobacteria bacterium]
MRSGRLLVVLALAALVLPTLACQSGGSAPAPAVSEQDDVHRIVASGRLRVGMSGVQPPLNMRDKAGALIGLDVELAQALADAMDLELVLVERPFGSLLEGLADDEFDLVISSLTITPARNARVAFVGPYLISGATMLTRQELVEELGEIEALDSADRTWGALEGSTGAELIQEVFPQATLVTTEDLASLIPQVAAGEIDGLVSDLPYIRFALARHPDSGLAMLPSPFTTEPLGVALSPDSPLFANLVQNYLNTLEYTGQLIQMKARWLNPGEWLSEIP